MNECACVIVKRTDECVGAFVLGTALPWLQERWLIAMALQCWHRPVSSTHSQSLSLSHAHTEFNGLDFDSFSELQRGGIIYLCFLFTAWICLITGLIY